MKLKYTFEIVDMGDEYIAVPVGNGASMVQGVLKLNKEGREIVDLLSSVSTVESIVGLLMAKYDNSRESLTKYVCSTIELLKSIDLIED